MRFRGGGVGHKYTRNATNHFLRDRSLDELARNTPNADDDPTTVNTASETIQDSEPDRNVDDDDEGTKADDARDFGYENPFGEQDIDTEEDEGEMVDELEDDIDALGPEDGETPDSDVEDLGFTDL